MWLARLRRFPVRVLGLFLLGYVLYVVDLRAVFGAFRAIGFVSILMACGAFAVLVLARCWRWHLLARALSPGTSLRQNVGACNASIWLGMATPARVGEFSRGLALAQQGHVPLRETTALVVVDLLLDLLTYGALAVAGAVVVGTAITGNQSNLVVAAALLAAYFALAQLPTVAGLAYGYLRPLRALPGATVLATLARRVGPTQAMQLAGATIAAASAYGLMLVALLSPMQLPFGVATTIAMVGLVGVSGAIPVTYFGFGTREVVLIWYLGEIGIAMETAVAVSFAFVLAQLIGIAVSLAFAAVGRLARLV